MVVFGKQLTGGSMAEWTFPIELALGGNKEYLIRRSQFGDGYSQSSGEGINDSKRSWEITCSGYLKDIEEIISFLDERKGYGSFKWKDILGGVGWYSAKEYRISKGQGGIYILNTTFEECFQM